MPQEKWWRWNLALTGASLFLNCVYSHWLQACLWTRIASCLARSGIQLSFRWLLPPLWKLWPPWDGKPNHDAVRQRPLSWPGGGPVSGPGLSPASTATSQKPSQQAGDADNYDDHQRAVGRRRRRWRWTSPRVEQDGVLTADTPVTGTVLARCVHGAQLILEHHTVCSKGRNPLGELVGN